MSPATIEPNAPGPGQVGAHADACGQTHPDTSCAKQGRQAGRQPRTWRAEHDLKKAADTASPGNSGTMAAMLKRQRRNPQTAGDQLGEEAGD